ncbi:MAG: hypothetical protein MMC33_008034 [Icmadophila ericetorum]|nr:hypothetical protein [Icmadophila ericetorum]
MVFPSSPAQNQTDSVKFSEGQKKLMLSWLRKLDEAQKGQSKSSKQNLQDTGESSQPKRFLARLAGDKNLLRLRSVEEFNKVNHPDPGFMTLDGDPKPNRRQYRVTGMCSSRCLVYDRWPVLPRGNPTDPDKLRISILKCAEMHAFPERVQKMTGPAFLTTTLKHPSYRTYLPFYTDDGPEKFICALTPSVIDLGAPPPVSPEELELTFMDTTISPEFAQVPLHLRAIAVLT